MEREPVGLAAVHADDELLDALACREDVRGDGLAGALAAWADEIDADAAQVTGPVLPWGARPAQAPQPRTVRLHMSRAAAFAGAAVLTMSGGSVAAALTGREVPLGPLDDIIAAVHPAAPGATAAAAASARPDVYRTVLEDYAKDKMRQGRTAEVQEILALMQRHGATPGTTADDPVTQLSRVLAAAGPTASAPVVPGDDTVPRTEPEVATARVTTSTPEVAATTTSASTSPTSVPTPTATSTRTGTATPTTATGTSGAPTPGTTTPTSKDPVSPVPAPVTTTVPGATGGDKKDTSKVDDAGKGDATRTDSPSASVEPSAGTPSSSASSATSASASEQGPRRESDRPLGEPTQATSTAAGRSTASHGSGTAPARSAGTRSPSSRPSTGR